MAKEIVTLQIGNYSNFVGTFWWNLQESAFDVGTGETSDINHEIMFREGLTLQKLQTYLPRTVCFDLKENFHSSKAEKCLYYDPSSENELTWNGSEVFNLEEHKEVENQPKNDDNDNTASVGGGSSNTYNMWSDNVLTPLHPKSIYTVKAGADSFGNYFDGIELAAASSDMDDIEGHIRYFCEECDHLQGFHLLVDPSDGFGGFTSCITSYLDEEFHNKAILAFPLLNWSPENQDLEKDKAFNLNSFLSLENLMSSCKLTVPLSCFSTIFPSKLTRPRKFPFINYDINSKNHTAKILSSAIDTSTLMYRTKDNMLDLYEYVNAMSMYGRQVAALSTVLPFPLFEDTSIFDTIKNLGSTTQLLTLTPSCDVMNNDDLTRLAVLRGLPLNLKMNLENIGKSHLENEFTEFKDLLNWYLQSMTKSRSSSLQQVKSPLKLDSSFNEIFDSRITSFGTISSKLRNPADDIDNISMMSSLHSNDSLQFLFRDLLFDMTHVNMKKFIRQKCSQLEEDHFKNLIENVRQYESCFSHDSDLM